MELVKWYILCLYLSLSKVIEELTSVIIAVGDSDGAAVNVDVETNSEVLWHEGVHTITLQDHLSLEEGTLRKAGVSLLGLDHHH